MSAQVTGSPLGRPVARDEKSIDACTAMVIAIVCDFAAHLMLKILSTDAQSMGTFSIAERINGLCSTRASSHGAQANNLLMTDSGFENQPGASAMGARGAATRVMSPKSKVNPTLSRGGAIEVIENYRIGNEEGRDRTGNALSAALDAHPD